MQNPSRGLRRLDQIIGDVLKTAWNERARSAALRAGGQSNEVGPAGEPFGEGETGRATRRDERRALEENTPQPITGREDIRRAQDASLTGDGSRRLRKVGE